MEAKLELVLDIAGVIATNFSPMLWKDLSLKYEIAYDDLVKFRKETREDLWTGKMEVREFWMRLVKRFPAIDEGYATTKLLSAIKPLPALHEIPVWSQYANIHLLSNHRIEMGETYHLSCSGLHKKRNRFRGCGLLQTSNRYIRKS